MEASNFTFLCYTQKLVNIEIINFVFNVNMNIAE